MDIHALGALRVDHETEMGSGNGVREGGSSFPSRLSRLSAARIFCALDQSALNGRHRDGHPPLLLFPTYAFLLCGHEI